MGDTGGIGVFGILLIAVIFFITAVLVIALLAPRSSRAEPDADTTAFSSSRRRKLSAGRIAIGIILLPFLFFSGILAYNLIKAEIEVRVHRQQDEQRKLNAARHPQP